MPLNAQGRAELVDLLPHGHVATREWLGRQALSRHAIDNLVKSRQLVRVSNGVYKRPGTSLKWQGVLSSLQRMGSDLTLGGLSALDMQGLAHYVPLSEQGTVHLYGREPLPRWAARLNIPQRFRRHGEARLFGKTPQSTIGKAFTTELPWAADEAYSLRTSTPERAYLEILSDVPEHVSFEHADELMQGLSSLSPRRLETLLREVSNVKAKRLFFWFADRHKHAWLKHLNKSAFDLGKGKRMLVRGGKLDPTYLITVPENLNAH